MDSLEELAVQSEEKVICCGAHDTLRGSGNDDSIMVTEELMCVLT